MDLLMADKKLSNKLISEWHPTKNEGIDCHEITYGSYEYIWWKCTEGHEWGATVNDRFKKNEECPKCLSLNKAKKKAETKEKRRVKMLIEVDFELSKQWHPTLNGSLTAETVIFDEGWIHRWWQCKRDHEWKEPIESRYKNKSSCPYCANKKVCEDNSLATTYPEIAREWFVFKNDNKTPYEIIFNSSQEVYWICSEGHTWREKISQRVKNKKGCPKCDLYQCSLAFLNPELAKEWHPTKNTGWRYPVGPEETKITYSKYIWWLCSSCGNEFEATVGSRNRGESRCNVCHPPEVKGKTSAVKRKGKYQAYNKIEDERILFESNLRESINNMEK
ncbi:TPA: zinc-ribbon domain-containing protein [Bacillus tropicus]